MIHVKVTTNDDGFLTLEAKGHGKSTLCASVSTLLQSQVRYLQELAQQFPDDVQVRVVAQSNFKEEK